MSRGLPSGTVIADRSRSLARQILAVAVCALATHAAIYGSLMPHGGIHRYFVWYAPLVAVLSFVSILGLPLALALALLAGRDSRATQILASLLPTRSIESAFGVDLFKLASPALVFLTLQETFERSLATNRLVLASFAPGTMLVLVAALVVTAAVVVLVERVVSTLTDAIRRDTRPALRRPARARWRAGSNAFRRRFRPLAVNGGLRAPPVFL